MTGIGPGVLDLASLTVGKWTEEQKAAMAAAYFEALPEQYRPYDSLDALITALDYSHIYVSMLWLGWTEEWAPPAQTGLNWLAEAMRLAEKLDLCDRIC